MDVAGGDRIRLDALLHLTARVADLTDHEAALLLTLPGHLLEGIEAVAAESRATRDDGVAGSLEVIIFDHDVAGQDVAQATLAPAAVDIDEFFTRNATGFEILGIP